MSEPTRYEILRSKTLSSSGPRFEVIEHDGEAYAVRQGSNRISKAINAHATAFDKGIETVIQTVHEAVPVLDSEGKQIIDDAEEPVVENVIGADGMPEVEPWIDASGNPVITIDGKRLMRGKKRALTADDGTPITKTVKVPRYTLGKRLYTKSDADVLDGQPDGEGSFIAKVVMAFRKVNDRDAARVIAKKP